MTWALVTPPIVGALHLSEERDDGSTDESGRADLGEGLRGRAA